MRKVRAAHRLKRTHGFAFSASEVQGEQAKLIRKYDTTKVRASGW